MAESLASMLPPSLPPCPVQFPGDPHSFPGWPGWSSVRVGQVGNRQGYRLQPPSSTHTAHRAQTATAHPLTSPVSLSQVHIDTQWCWCVLKRTCTSTSCPPSYQLEILVLSFPTPLFSFCPFSHQSRKEADHNGVVESNFKAST